MHLKNGDWNSDGNQSPIFAKDSASGAVLTLYDALLLLTRITKVFVEGIVEPQAACCVSVKTVSGFERNWQNKEIVNIYVPTFSYHLWYMQTSSQTKTNK